MAMTPVTTKSVCLHNERTVAELMAGCYPLNVNTSSYQILQAVTDAANQTGLVSFDRNSVKPSNDSCQTWEFRYKSKVCKDPTEGEITCSSPCEVGTPMANDWKYANVSMSDAITAEFTTHFDDADCKCESAAQLRRENLQMVFEQLLKAANKRVGEQLASGVGNYYAKDCANAVNSLTDPKTIKLLGPDGKPQPMSLFKINQQYKRMGLSSKNIFTIGGESFDAYNYGRALYSGGGCNGQQDPNRGPQLPHYIDYDLDDYFADGNEHIVTFPAGGLFLFKYNKYVTKAYESDTMIKRTFDLGAAFGMPGFVVDHSIVIVECECLIIEKFHYHIDVCKPPEDAFSAECGQCSNYCLNWIVDCDMIGCDDTKC